MTRNQKSSLCRVKIRIPAAIKLIDLYVKEIGSEPSPKDLQSLAWILNSMLSSAANYYSDDQSSERPFFPFCSGILVKTVRDYKKYLNMLVRMGIVETDNRFIKGEKCRGYRFTSNILSEGLTLFEITYWPIRKAIIRSRKKKVKTPYGYSHLKKWWNGELKFDKKGAVGYLEAAIKKNKDMINKLKSDKNNNSTKNVEQLINENEKISLAIIISEKFREPFSILVDKSGYRMHTMLTRLKRDLRKFLSYGEKKLVGIDIKNSQPYLMTLLLRKEFWNGENELEIGKVKRDNNKKRSKEIICDIKCIITLTESLETLDGEGFRRNNFVQDVVDGSFYERLQEEFTGLRKGGYSRDDVKKLVYVILFGDKRSQHFPVYKAFKKRYPEVSKLIEAVKKDDHRALPLILQRLESFLVLQVICKKISKKRPDIPLFTIHDSIVTTEGNEMYVMQAMKEELEKKVGLSPKLSIQPFSEKVKQLPTIIYPVIRSLRERPITAPGMFKPFAFYKTLFPNRYKLLNETRNTQ